MDKINKFYVEMDNPSLSYFPGDYVSGRVIVHYQKVKQTEGITITFTGKCKVEWRERTVKNMNTQATFRDKDTYFNEKVILSDGKGVVLPEGRNTFPFNFRLPSNLPSTFKGQFGFIAYNFKAVMKRSFKTDKKVKIQFTVNAIVDLNNRSEAAKAIELNTHKKISWYCTNSGTISSKLTIPKSGFTPGERIPFLVELHNTSKKEVKRSIIMLNQEIQYKTCKDHARHETRVLKCNTRGPLVGAGESETWQGSLQVPAVPPTGLGKCRIINVTYIIAVQLLISSANPVRGEVPVVIGTIPMRNNFEELSAVPQYDSVDLFSVPRSAAIFKDYPDLPPPTYAEAVKVLGKNNGSENTAETANASNSTADIEKDIAPDSFVPKYITYGAIN